MRLILASLGTDGDILPYAGLGVTLQQRGHQATLVACETYRDLATAHGLAFETLLSARDNRDWLEHPDFWHPMKTVRHSAQFGVRHVARQYALMEKLAAPPDTVFVTSPAVFGASFVHEKFGRPLVHLVLQPWLIPSVDALPVMPVLNPPSWTPRLALRGYCRLLDLVGDLLVGRHLNRTRATLGLPPVRRLFTHWFSRDLVLGLFPPWYGPPQADWPANLRLTGFPFFDGPAVPGLPAEVLAFCEAGAPPIACTFGTGMKSATTQFHEVLRACESLQMRVIFLTRHAEQLPAPLPSFALRCAFASFAELFPRCSAVLHHGGIGTTARALQAGVPQLILPIAFDQRDNADRIRRMGTGTSLPWRSARADRIAAALRSVLAPPFPVRCREISQRLAHTQALSTAADEIEAFLARRRPASGDTTDGP